MDPSLIWSDAVVNWVQCLKHRMQLGFVYTVNGICIIIDDHDDSEHLSMHPLNLDLNHPDSKSCFCRWSSPVVASLTLNGDVARKEHVFGVVLVAQEHNRSRICMPFFRWTRTRIWSVGSELRPSKAIGNSLLPFNIVSSCGSLVSHGNIPTNYSCLET